MGGVKANVSHAECKRQHLKQVGHQSFPSPLMGGVGDLGHQQHWIRARREELIEECATIICKHQFVDVTASQLQKHCNLAAFSTAMEKEVKVAKGPKLQMSTRNLHRCILAVHIPILSWFFAIMFLLVLQFSPLRLVPIRIHTAFFRTKME